MRTPSCLLFAMNGIGELASDYTISLSKESDTCHIFACQQGAESGVKMPLTLAYELVNILTAGLEILEPKSAAPTQVISPKDLAWEDKMAKAKPTEQGVSWPLQAIKAHDTAQAVDKHVGTISSGPSDDYDDPEKVWCIRHEHKDLWFTTLDMQNDTRECSGRRPADAHPFPTKYSAHRFMQNFKQGNPVTLLEFPARHIVSYKTTEHDKPHYWTSSGPVTNKETAERLTVADAQKVLENIPSYLISKTEKVRA